MFWRLVKIGAWFQLFSLLMIQWVGSYSIWWGVNMTTIWAILSLFWMSTLVMAHQREKGVVLLRKEIH